MQRYLLDTNAFFELLSTIAGKPVRKDGYDFTDIVSGEFYISSITLVEIISVIGKYSRGEVRQWQKCNRIISDNETVCQHSYLSLGRKPWNTKFVSALFKLIKEIVNGDSPFLKVKVLPFDETVLKKSEQFILKSLKYKFGSHDAVIAATAIINSDELNMCVVTSDKGLKAAMREENMLIYTPGQNTYVN